MWTNIFLFSFLAIGLVEILFSFIATDERLLRHYILKGTAIEFPEKFAFIRRILIIFNGIFAISIALLYDYSSIPHIETIYSYFAILLAEYFINKYVEKKFTNDKSEDKLIIQN